MRLLYTNRATTLLVALSIICATSWAQGQGTVKIPQVVSGNYLDSIGAKIQFSRANKMTAEGNAASKQQRVRSVPNFTRSFMFKGQTFPYTMVGQDPQRGGTTRVDTSLVTIQFFFDEFVDQHGKNIVIDAATVVPRVLNSPNYENSSYGTGFTQFSDAIQRAEFFNVMESDWHTLLDSPRMLQPVQIEVPFGSSIVLQSPSGTIFALINFDFFVSQLNTILQFEPFRLEELAIVLTKDALFYQGGDPTNCCVLGFHTALETAVHGNVHDVQTFATASWIDPGIFRSPDVADVNALSHEIAEWMNDPFVNNVVPPWEFPGSTSNPPACQANLETGDPVEVFFLDAFHVTLDGFTYHPQTEALLQWFEREVPSSAFQHAYSYPDTTKLTAPLPCPGT